MKNLLLIGSGQLGSRYLQSIIKKNLNYKIIVVDKLNQSLDTAKKIWNEFGGNKTSHKIQWSLILPKEIKHYDLVIIATSSKDRASLIEDIASKVNINYWVIEKILAQSTNELNEIKKATKSAKKVYVNTPKRQMNWYKKIKSKFPCKPYKIIKTGNLWNLACNSIHYIDLVAWWTEDNLISINCEGLNSEWFKSKRDGYFEISGKLLAKYSNGTELILESSKEEIDNILKIDFKQQGKCDINEKKGTAIFSDGSVVSGKVDLQSEMGEQIISKILSEGNCGLPSLEESIEQHSIFLDSLLDHWNRYNKKSDKLVPIT